MDILTALLNTLPFPLTPVQAKVIAVGRRLNTDSEYTFECANSKTFLLAKADCIKFILTSPNVSEGGVSISYSDRKLMMGLANEIYSKFGEPLISEENPTVEFLHDW